MAYTENMVIIETATFTRQVKSLFSDDEYRKLQNELLARPDAGDLIPGSGGLRKIRWKGSGRGKRGGTRIIYYWFVQHHTVLMLLLYPKSKQDDLTSQQLKILQQLVEREFS